MIWAYYRVSTDDQDYKNQKSGVLKFCEYRGFEIDKEVIEEGMSGKIHFKKRELGKLIRKLKKGDTLIVSELSRLSRQMTDCVELAKIFTDKEVTVHCVKENMEISNSALGLMVMSVFAFSAQIERERISERTKEALQRRKAEGFKIGRKEGSKNLKHKLDGIGDEIQKMLDKNITKKIICKKFNITYPTLRKFINERTEQWI